MTHAKGACNLCLGALEQAQGRRFPPAIRCVTLSGSPRPSHAFPLVGALEGPLLALLLRHVVGGVAAEGRGRDQHSDLGSPSAAECAISTHTGRVNAKHRRTLAAVFREPVSGTLAWADSEALLLAAGARKIEGRGSRVRFAKDGHVETFHRPHPAKEAKRYQVRAARAFLTRIGVTP